jgi:hypothetical protein
MKKLRIAFPETAVITETPMQNLFNWAKFLEEKGITLNNIDLPCELHQRTLLYRCSPDEISEYVFYIENVGKINNAPLYIFKEKIYSHVTFTYESASFYLAD